jgi:uncharacterized protein YegP (UPF0339 family)
MSKFEIEKNYTGYFWRFKSSNGEKICHSEIYNSKQSALYGVASCKENAKTLSNFTLFLGNDNQYYWNLKGRNGEKLCQSEGYTQKAGAENGINVCHRDAPTAEVFDRTLMSA